MKTNLFVLAVIVASAIWTRDAATAADGGVEPSLPKPISLPIEGELPRASATQWLNSKPLTAADLRGKVVLIDFWTYSCINWRRRYPMSARGPRNTRTKDWS